MSQSNQLAAGYRTFVSASEIQEEVMHGTEVGNVGTSLSLSVSLSWSVSWTWSVSV